MRTFLLQCKSGALTQPHTDWKWARIGAMVVGGVLVLALLSSWTFDAGQTYPRYILRRIRTLVRDATHWSATAQQDNNPLLALVHATYAIAYLNTARHLVSDTDIERMLNIQPREFMFELQQQHDMIVQALVTQCPALKPATGSFGVHTGWVGGQAHE